MEIQRPTRYPLRGRVQLSLPDKRVLAGHTVDISIGGLCIVLDAPLAVGGTYPLRFEMTVGGELHLITAVAQSVYGVFASGGFRVGLTFKQGDPQRSALIASLAGKRSKARAKESTPGIAPPAPE